MGFLVFVGESLPRWYFRGQRYKAPLKGYRCFFGPAVGGLTEKSWMRRYDSERESRECGCRLHKVHSGTIGLGAPGK